MSSREFFPATVYYSGDGYSTAGPKLMGRQAAGQGFLRAYVQATQAEDHLASAWLASPSKQGEEEARIGFKKAGLASQLEVWSSRDMAALQKSGCLYVPQPNLSDLASQRIRTGERKFSLCGITHTTASHAVMSTLAQLPLAPLRPWDAVICTSQAVLKSVNQLLEQQTEYLKWKLGATRFELPQLPVIPLGVHTQDYKFTEQQKKAAREQLGLSESDVAVLFVGRLSFHAKAHPHPMLVGLQNVAQISSKKIHLIQAGWFANEPIEQAFRQAAQELAPGVKHHYLDGRDAVQRTRAWAGADIFCSLADNIQETFGLTPIEAMAASLPVVVSDWDGYKDTVRHEVDGFRVPTTIAQAGDGVELASLYERGLINYDMYCGYSCEFVSVEIAKATEYFSLLVENASLRLKMGKAAHERAVQCYDWAVIMTEYQSLWRSLSEKRLEADLTKVGPIPIKAAVDRPDPFDLFSGYATQRLSNDSVVHLCRNVDQSEFDKTLMLSVHKYAALMLPNWKQAEPIFLKLKKTDASVKDLLSEVDSTQKSRYRRFILWMMKVGWLTVA